MESRKRFIELTYIPFPLRMYSYYFSWQLSTNGSVRQVALRVPLADKWTSLSRWLYQRLALFKTFPGVVIRSL